MNIINKDLKKRILDISYQRGLSHIGSCLTAVDLIKEIYDSKEKGDRVVLSSGHAGLALYCVIEDYYLERPTKSAEDIFNHHGVHPDRCVDCHIDCSAGSLGHGLGIAVGMVLAKPQDDVWVVTSDGELAEGSMYEALRIIDRLGLHNIHIFVNCNGYSGYDAVGILELEKRLKPYKADIRFFKTNIDYLNVDALKGLKGHYTVLDDDMYETAIQSLSKGIKESLNGT